MGEISILTFNVFANPAQVDVPRMEMQAERIRELNPDIICLQEVFSTVSVELFRKRFSDYHAVFCNRKRHPLINSMLKATPIKGATKQVIAGNISGLMTLVRKDRFQLREHRTTYFRNQVAPFLSTDWFIQFLMPRAYQTVSIANEKQKIELINTHLSVGVRNWKRFRQIKELLGKLRSKKATHDAIVCGDFNSHTVTREIAWLKQKAGIIDTWEKGSKDPGNGWTWDERNPRTHGFLKEPSQRVDYIFVRPKSGGALDLLDSRVVLNEEPYLSDHYGVHSKIALSLRDY